MKINVVIRGRLEDGRLFQRNVPFVLNECENLTRVQLWVEGFDHPVCDLSMSLHEGSWIYLPPGGTIDDNDE